jgi:hypothetical protein
MSLNNKRVFSSSLGDILFLKILSIRYLQYKENVFCLSKRVSSRSKIRAFIFFIYVNIFYTIYKKFQAKLHITTGIRHAATPDASVRLRATAYTRTTLYDIPPKFFDIKGK